MTTASTDGVQLLSALVRIPVDRVKPGPNARGDIGPVADLAVSIATLGPQKPILVCQIADDRYEILDGHRRFAAVKKLGLDYVDAILRRKAPEPLRIQQQLAMHMQAKAFDPIAEATALHELMWKHGLAREEIAKAVGRSSNWVRDRIGLLQLSPTEQEAVTAGQMTVGAAKTAAQSARAERTGRPITERPAPRQRAHHCPTCRCEVNS